MNSLSYPGSFQKFFLIWASGLQVIIFTYIDLYVLYLENAYNLITFTPYKYKNFPLYRYLVPNHLVQTSEDKFRGDELG